MHRHLPAAGPVATMAFAWTLPLAALLFAALLFATPPLRSQSAPSTTAEQSGGLATTRSTDVQRFVDACTTLARGDRLSVRVAGKSTEGRALLAVHVAEPGATNDAAQHLRALLLANIHAGEVDGKEALLELLREFAQGEHDDLLQHFELCIVPNYNVDGAEASAVGNRPGQNGPDEVGQRANGGGLDLNRDFVKADAPETRALLTLVRTFDPHLFVDLHTTNGSYHGYHLTYSPCLSPNLDGEVASRTRALLLAAQIAMRTQGFETFDYGNFETGDWDGGGAPASAQQRGWFTYDSRARYGVNWFGLRNRIAVLSESYSYCDFATRIAASKGFVLALLRSLATDVAGVTGCCARADQRLVAPTTPVWFGSDTRFAPPEHLPVLVGEVDEIAATAERPLRRVRREVAVAETMPVVRAFRAGSTRQLPIAWAIREPSPEVLARLDWHGVEYEPVKAVRSVRAQQFAITARRKPRPPYQGHQELQLRGVWLPTGVFELSPGTVVVPARQRLARLAATLLEPESEDSLSTWNFFEATTGEHYPVLRIVADPH